MHHKLTRFSFLAFAVAVSACSTLNSEMASAVRQCKSYLSTGDYVAIETASIPENAIWQVVSRNQRANMPASFLDYQITGHPGGYAKPPKIRFALLQSHEDELVFCEVTRPACSPKIIWFKRQSGAGSDVWVLDRTNGDEQVCVVS